MAAAPIPFDQAFAVVVGEEGGFSNVLTDRGNWTSGRVGVGTLKGTKWGISAAVYPGIDIENLTLADAKAIYLRDYWNWLWCGTMPPGLALLVFDAGVNNGQPTAMRWLQLALGVADDGVPGIETSGALHAAMARDAKALMIEFMARRINAMAQDSGWAEFGLGWSRRLAGLPWAAMAMTAIEGPTA